MADSIKAEAVFKSLFDHHLHQDRLVWMHIRTILALQGAVLAACYVVRGSWLVVLLSLLGGVFTSIIYMLTLKARLDRDMNLDVIQTLLRETSSEEVRRLLPCNDKGQMLMTGSELNGNRVQWSGLGFPFVRGYLLLRWAVYLALIMDVVAVPLLYCVDSPLQQ